MKGEVVDCTPIKYVFIGTIVKSRSFRRTLLGAYSVVKQKNLNSTPVVDMKIIVLQVISVQGNVPLLIYMWQIQSFKITLMGVQSDLKRNINSIDWYKETAGFYNPNPKQ